MTAHAAFTIQPDASRNLMRLTFFGHVGADAMETCSGQVELLLPELLPGFRVLTDLTGLESMDLDCVRHLTRIMDQFRIKGAGTVVRIIPDPSKDIGFNLLSIIHLRPNVTIVTCRTRAEAERALDL